MAVFAITSKEHFLGSSSTENDLKIINEYYHASDSFDTPTLIYINLMNLLGPREIDEKIF